MDVDQITALGRALSDPTRVRVLLAALDGINSPLWISAQMGYSPGTVSHHLKKLEEAGLIERRRRGTIRQVLPRHDRWRQVLRAAEACTDPNGGQITAASMLTAGE